MFGREEWIALLESTLNGVSPPRIWNQKIEAAESTPDLSNLDISQAQLSGWSFKGCNLARSKFQGGNLERACFNNAILTGADLQRTRLMETSFVRAKADCADLRSAEAQGADFSWCDLRGALLDGVDLEGVVLWRTDLRGAKYRPFTRRADQHYLTDGRAELEGTGAPLPIGKALQVLGAMTGVPHRWRGEKNDLELHIPQSLAGPEEFLAEFLRENHLQCTPVKDETGRTLYMRVTESGHNLA